MGCGASKKQNTVDLTTLQKFSAPGSVPPERLSVLLPKTGPLLETSYWSRLSLSTQPHEVQLSRSKFTVNYAYTSLRGFYPDALQKSNQDEVCAHQLLADDMEQLLFAVFDGHGSEGHLCAQYAKNKVFLANICGVWFYLHELSNKTWPTGSCPSVHLLPALYRPYARRTVSGPVDLKGHHS